MTSTVYCVSIVFNGVTYNSSHATGGPIQVSYTHGSSPVEARSGDDFYAREVHLVDGVCRATVVLPDAKPYTGALNIKDDLVLNLLGKAAKPITLKDMILFDTGGDQGRANLGSGTLQFVHENSSGSEVPIA